MGKTGSTVRKMHAPAPLSCPGPMFVVEGGGGGDAGLLLRGGWLGGWVAGWLQLPPPSGAEFLEAPKALKNSFGLN